MKKNFLTLLSILFIMFFIFGCSNFSNNNQTSKIGFKITIPNTRNFSSQEYELSVSLKYANEKFEKTENKSVKSGTTEEIVFTDILIGSIVKIEAKLFADDKILYQGESDWTTVKLNNNKISIKLEKVESETDEPVDPEIPEEPENPVEPENPTKIEAYYTVNHYKQKIENDEYEFFESHKFKGYVEDYTQAVPLTLEGFTAVPVNQKIITKDENTTVDIYYNRNIISLSFNTNGGTEISSIYGKYGATITSPDNPTKQGYSFEGWNPSLPTTFPSENQSYEATWKPITYTVIFDANGGTGTIENQIFTYDIPQKLNKNNFTKQNYDFDGWNTESNGSGISYKNEQEVSNLTDINDDEIILYAQWKIQNQVSTVSFSTSETDIDYGTLISLSCEDADAEIYYTTDDSEFSAENWIRYTSEISITQNITIRAIAIKTGKINSNITQQTYNLKTYTITFNLDDGILETDIILVNSGSNYDLSNLVPTKNGYEFVGWKYEDNIVSNLTDIRKNIKITATWKPITYTVIFDANAPTGVNVDGAMNSQTFNYDESQTLNQNTFTCDLYAFIGWNTVKTPSDSEPGKFYQDKEEVKNLTSENNISITLYAQWEKIQTTVSVTFPTYTDPENLIEKTEQDGNNVIFTASEDYSSYAWFIDGNKDDCSTSEFTLDTSNMFGGVYTIMLVVTDSEDNMFSAEYQLVITK